MSSESRITLSTTRQGLRVTPTSGLGVTSASALHVANRCLLAYRRSGSKLNCFVPRCALGGFVRRRLVDARRADQARFMLARLRRRNPLPSTSVAVPESIAEILPLTCASHAFAPAESPC